MNIIHSVSQVVLALLLTMITHGITGSDDVRHPRQLLAENNLNMPMGLPRQNPSVPSNNMNFQRNMPNLNNIPPMSQMNSNNQMNIPINSNIPSMQYNNFDAQMNGPINNNNNMGLMMASNQQPPINNQPSSQRQILNQGQPIFSPQQQVDQSQMPSQQPMNQARSQGFYNGPQFQQSPFAGAKPNGWFGTNHINWVSSKDSEVDKNKLAAAKNSPDHNYLAHPNMGPVNRDDGGPAFLMNVAKNYASKGHQAFTLGPHESTQGHGAVCSNFENVNGFVFGRFPCPLPPSTGMNQLDMFCCGPTNYQYCCNIQEFSQSQRGGFSDNVLFGNQRQPKLTTYPSSTKKILAVILPIVSVLVLSGIGILVFLYYKKFRQVQYRVGKPTGAVRLHDNYSALAQELPNEQAIFSN